MLTRHGLPKSNSSPQVGIIHGRQPALSDEQAAFDRRAIPSGASETLWTAPDGHPIRRLDWPEPPGGRRGALLFMPGRGDAYEKYLETLAHWHRRGWRLTAADWRGQGGSGRFGADPLTGHIDDFAIWLDDLTALWNDWAAAQPEPKVLAAHSMGAHLALRAVAEGRIAPDALVLVAPMLSLSARLPIRLLRPLARLVARFGNARRPAWSWGKRRDEQALAFRSRLLTHDDARYADEMWWWRERPELAMGPGSWGWLAAAFASMRALTARGALERVSIPVLILATSADALVGYRAAERAARRLARAELVRFGAEARHEILREVDEVRDRALRRIDDFLDRVAPAAG